MYPPQAYGPNMVQQVVEVSVCMPLRHAAQGTLTPFFVPAIHANSCMIASRYRRRVVNPDLMAIWWSSGVSVCAIKYPRNCGTLKAAFGVPLPSRRLSWLAVTIQRWLIFFSPPLCCFTYATSLPRRFAFSSNPTHPLRAALP